MTLEDGPIRIRRGFNRGRTMADFFITGVRFNTARTHIEYLEVGDDLGTSVGPRRTESRYTVVANLASKAYQTAPPSRTNPGTLDRGALVRVVPIDGVNYLRTDANRTARDNLDNLPEF